MIAVALTGPISATSPTMSRNASALQTTASTMIDTITAVDGHVGGQPPVNSTNGT